MNKPLWRIPARSVVFCAYPVRGALVSVSGGSIASISHRPHAHHEQDGHPRGCQVEDYLMQRTSSKGTSSTTHGNTLLW